MAERDVSQASGDCVEGFWGLCFREDAAVGGARELGQGVVSRSADTTGD